MPRFIQNYLNPSQAVNLDKVANIYAFVAENPNKGSTLEKHPCRIYFNSATSPDDEGESYYVEWKFAKVVDWLQCLAGDVGLTLDPRDGGDIRIALGLELSNEKENEQL